MKTSSTTQSERQIKAFELADQDYQLYFLFSPTWQIKPQYFGNLEESDFAIGCLDYFLNIEPKYNAIKQYLDGYNAVEELYYQIYQSSYNFN